ncbi:MAG: urease accessory protein [Zetaproteobacteria bacterium CG12_big_fil_rev_8_21_14_0_65_55_1124]|nr:MAG: urease accessory protein [Zetaproteobacteria bacterium CG1_02_55_237]PIS20214.1 MAG: urease accessory protein [Zetaproteobacteria bacterium CG08_land_8_20_14_0_20_55_17]PIW43371.1 MAG: urease accessory protein [Zetaproteobacteria bacterium CG12_big_fil_rev_8_21_14_0_65_55_1124]PIY53077.1 MAG: urease accessory protein [Zetaproteobacteria bacterium CG_4_10_14_0_8_um_filter_55_43]PIZ39987.1 MAG: urease accessory protein [Zetaproteobacteria bacterium CG_4_10_14_0_2_um_filter_55_20]PJB81273
MIEILLMGFLLGMRHAMESDHVAAVASLVTKSPSLRESIRLGSMWGLGHTVTLFIFGSAVMLLDHMIPERMAMMLEFAVGIMLVMLGIDVVRRFMRERVHFHSHRHADGTLHFHAHAHADEINHASDSHMHMHREKFPLRALLVGIMHGMAGSAAMIVLTLQTVQSFGMGLIYITLFGLGSIGGMAALSMAIMLPLRHSASRYARAHQYLQFGIGTATIVLGISLMLEIGINGKIL